jgi:hypothetical protein
MVIPKMSRPSGRSAGAAPPTPVSTPVPAETNAPDFAFVTAPDRRTIPMPAVAGVVAVFILLIAGVFSFLNKPAVAVSKTGGAAVKAGPALPVAMGGWTTVEWPRRIGLLRASSNLTDFRMEFEGQIEAKAMGWMFRAQDANNFYAMKLAIVTPGRDPIVALQRYAVVKGQDQALTQVPLPKTFRLDTIYEVRLEALGNRFTTWVMDQKVDEWSDNRFPSGGVGYFSDRGERASLKGDMKVYPLLKVSAK